MLLSVSKVESAVEEIVTPDTWRKYCTRKYLKSSPMEQPQFVAKGKVLGITSILYLCYK